MDREPTGRERLIAALIVASGVVAIVIVVRSHPACVEGAKLYAPFQLAKNDADSPATLSYRPLVCKYGRGWFD